MRRANRPKQPPYLTEYIRYAVDSRLSDWYKDVPPLTVGIGVGVSFLVGSGPVMMGPTSGNGYVGVLTGALTFCVYMLGVFGITERRRARDEDPQVGLRREAKLVAQHLDHLMHEKRLHRDLSPDVIELIEEAARSWHRARSALQSPYWKRADLPTHFRSVRDQSLLAIDQGMQEMLVLFATSVPKEPRKWTLGEMADEVIGHDVFANRGSLDHVSPYFQEATGVAAKLQELAVQVESVSQQLAGQELITGAPKPGSGLEATLAELRQLKQAEEELHQDLRG